MCASGRCRVEIQFLVIFHSVWGSIIFWSMFRYTKRSIGPWWSVLDLLLSTTYYPINIHYLVHDLLLMPYTDVSLHQNFVAKYFSSLQPSSSNAFVQIKAWQGDSKTNGFKAFRLRLSFASIDNFKFRNFSNYSLSWQPWILLRNYFYSSFHKQCSFPGAFVILTFFSTSPFSSFREIILHTLYRSLNRVYYRLLQLQTTFGIFISINDRK